jgi:hypothetical protein
MLQGHGYPLGKAVPMSLGDQQQTGVSALQRSLLEDTTWHRRQLQHSNTAITEHRLEPQLPSIDCIV